MTEEQSELMSGLSVGDRGRVCAMTLAGEQRQRLMEMGLTVGSEFQVVRFAPLGDPLEIKVRGYHLSLRKSDAAGVRVVRL